MTVLNIMLAKKSPQIKHIIISFLQRQVRCKKYLAQGKSRVSQKSCTQPRVALKKYIRANYLVRPLCFLKGEGEVFDLLICNSWIAVFKIDDTAFFKAVFF